MKLKLVDPRIFRESFNKPPAFVERKESVQHTYLRNARIPACSLGKRVSCYNGQIFSSFLVKVSMLNHKFGEFVRTKRTGAQIHEKKKKGKGKKNKK